MRFNMPLAAPCLCTKSTTAMQNASLVDCPHNEGRVVDRFIPGIQQQNEFECSQRNQSVRKMNISSLVRRPAWLEGPSSKNGGDSADLHYGKFMICNGARCRRSRIKDSLTSSQLLRLLCMNGRCNLSTVRSIQAIENAYDKGNPHHPDRPGASCGHSDGRFGSCCPVCNVGGIGRSWQRYSPQFGRSSLGIRDDPDGVHGCREKWVFLPRRRLQSCARSLRMRR
jgi:hypothetical protein